MLLLESQQMMEQRKELKKVNRVVVQDTSMNFGNEKLKTPDIPKEVPIVMPEPENPRFDFNDKPKRQKSIIQVIKEKIINFFIEEDPYVQ